MTDKEAAAQNELEAYKDKIWVTYKTRILAEQRYRVYGTATHVLNTYFSLHLILYSIFADRFEALVQYFDKILLCLSVVIFASSLAVYAFRFFEKANEFRSCYLALQELLDEHVGYDELISRYHQILKHYPNHAESDYDDLIFESSVLRNNPIKSKSNGKDIRPTWKKYAMYWLRKGTFYLIVAAGALIPLPPYLLLF